MPEEASLDVNGEHGRVEAAHYSRTYMGVVPARTPLRVVEVEAGRVWWCPQPPSRKPP